ncbi:MAG: hypothetical protein KJ065_23700 [Anaerolineae bacterium]|nr:hypothetical protein [Anaerolineae bacterium]
MHRNKRLICAIVLVLVGIQIVACAPAQTTTAVEHEEPARVEKVDGSEFNRVALTERAAERLDIQTAEVSEEVVNGATRRVIPYSAIIYGLNGETWIYVSSAPLTFVREVISIDRINGDLVVLDDGPPVGTLVATVGVAELYGIDTGVGK